MANYPASVPSLKKNFQNETPNQNQAASWQNQISSELENVMTTLGTNPHGSAGSLGARVGTIEFIRAGQSVGVLPHGSNASAARPTTHQSFIWIGTVTPANGTVNDIYLDVDP